LALRARKAIKTPNASLIYLQSLLILSMTNVKRKRAATNPNPSRNRQNRSSNPEDLFVPEEAVEGVSE
jgi:hypothetical protein